MSFTHNAFIENSPEMRRWCIENGIRREMFIKAEPYYIILRKSERDSFFKDYPEARLHRTRQEMIHRRITFRGLLQKYNSK